MGLSHSIVEEKVGCLQQQLGRNPPTLTSEDLTRETQDTEHTGVHLMFDVSRDTQH